MRRWKPYPSLGRWVTAALLLASLASCGAVVAYLARVFSVPPERWPIDLGLYGWVVALVALLALSGILAYRLAAVLTLAYDLDRNGLYITWLGNRAVVPLDQISGVDIGAPGASVSTPLGLVAARSVGRTADGRPLYRFSTKSLPQSLVIHTPQAAYAIAPVQQDAFVQDLEQRRSLGAIKSMSAGILPGRVFSYAFWNDSIVKWSLLLALVLNLALLAALFARYPLLDTSLPMQFNLAGQPIGLRPKYQLFFMPLAAFGLALLNLALGLWLYTREQTGARLLQVATVLVQLLFAVACLTIASPRF